MRIATGIATLALLAGVALPAAAADAITVPLDANAALPVAQHAFDWAGFYAGVFGAVRSPVVAKRIWLGDVENELPRLAVCGAKLHADRLAVAEGLVGAVLCRGLLS